MLRQCDGTDPFLVMIIDDESGEKINNQPSNNGRCEPCNCGKVFDDSYYSVFWPHEPI